MSPTVDEWKHWFLSARVEQPLLCKPRVSRALELVDSHIKQIRDDIYRLRESVLTDPTRAR